MSIKVMTAVWPLRLSAFEKLVLLALADIADDAGRCFPAIANLMHKCGMSESTVRRSIAHLEGQGHVVKEPRSGRSTVYHVYPQPLSNRHPCPIDTPVSLTPTPVRLTPPEKKKTSSLDPSPTRQLKPVVDEPPPSNLNVEAWHRWEQYRKAIGKPIKPPSVAAAQRKLAGYGASQAVVVEQSIANGWQGLFPLRPEQRKQEASEWR